MDKMHGDAGGQAPERVGETPVDRHLHHAGCPGVIRRRLHRRIGEIAVYIGPEGIPVDLRRVLAQP